MRLLLIWFINAAALFAVPYLMHSITMSSGWTALVAKLIQQHAEYTLQHRTHELKPVFGGKGGDAA